MTKNSKFIKEQSDKETKIYFETITLRPLLRLPITTATFSDNNTTCTITLPLKHATILWIYETYELYKWIEILFIKHHHKEINSTNSTGKEKSADGFSELHNSDRVTISYASDNRELLEKVLMFKDHPKDAANCDNFEFSFKYAAILVREKQLLVSGLSSIVRFMIKFVFMKLTSQLANDATGDGAEPNIEKQIEKFQELLGFRGGCLTAAAEVSVWTKFCEVDIFNGLTETLLKLSHLSLEMNLEMSKELLRFEHHLGKPVKIHNVKKEARIKKKAEGLELGHDFAEGPRMLLSDLIVFPCVHLFTMLCGVDTFKINLPNTANWYSTMNKLFLMNKTKKLQLPSLLQNKLEGVITLKIPCVPEESLYKTDRQRYNPTLRTFTRQYDVDEALKSFAASNIPSFSVSDVPTFLNWEGMPALVHPEGGKLPEKRSERKCQQLSSMAVETMKVVGEKIKRNCGTTTKLLKVVDFCSGGGHLGILLAWLLPKCQIILVENNEESLRRGWERIDRLGLTNVLLYQCNLDYFDSQFDVGVGLHCCGLATDLMLLKCFAANASFVISPCCYGGIQSNHMLGYPRSRVFRESGISLKHYFILAHSSDQTHDEKNKKTEQGKLCMRLIDTDRGLNAQQNGYQVSLMRIVPDTASPKNHILVGISPCLFANNLPSSS